MANYKLKLEDFKSEKITKIQQKTVRGGDDPVDPNCVDPSKGLGSGNQQK
ncbi:hypothetical protein BC749_101822 [Flavobacterium araucananum]|jgi:hypothetical protein|nr:rSAM-modified peptide [Flavobacterium araucananum]PWK02748.1 hypothetical protein BC749_101822 [Flavobacterium araucananum]